jgi:hypothetical protein
LKFIVILPLEEQRKPAIAANRRNPPETQRRRTPTAGEAQSLGHDVDDLGQERLGKVLILALDALIDS